MNNVSTSTGRRIKGIFASINVGKESPVCLLVEDENGDSVFWRLSYALMHSSEITDFDLFAADIESGKIRLDDEDGKLWQSWRNRGSQGEHHG